MSWGTRLALAAIALALGEGVGGLLAIRDRLPPAILLIVPPIPMAPAEPERLGPPSWEI